MKEYEVVIDGLRKDLAGANARLADVAGMLYQVMYIYAGPQMMSVVRSER